MQLSPAQIDDCFKPEASVMATYMYDSMCTLQRFDMDDTLPRTSVGDIVVRHDSSINFPVASDLISSNMPKFVRRPMNRIIPALHNNSTPCRSRRKSA